MIDETRESFDRYFTILEREPRKIAWFKEALGNLNFKYETVADIGAGRCWTSVLLAGYPGVKVVYAVEPNEQFRRESDLLVKHSGTGGKVRVINGSFLEPNVPEKVDLVLLSSSFHHCPDDIAQTMIRKDCSQT